MSEKSKRSVITYAMAVNEGIAQVMEKYSSVFLIGEGVPDPKGIFGTTLGLQKRFGKNRVLDMPVSENGLTGMCIGAALCGLRPILTHQRADFSLLSFDQIINNAAKWFYMFGGQKPIPLVISLVVGRGWGQGSQHAQDFHSLFMHIPGLKVVMPVTPYDAKGLLIASVEDNNPVIFIQHRWLHNIKGYVPENYYSLPIGKSKLVRKGGKLTVVACSYMTVEVLKAFDILHEKGIDFDLIDLRSIIPLDIATVIDSVKRTGKLLVVDAVHKTLGLPSEVITLVTEKALSHLKLPPRRITLPDVPVPTSRSLAFDYYPNHVDIAAVILEMAGEKKLLPEIIALRKEIINSDVPDSSFTGPF